MIFSTSFPGSVCPISCIRLFPSLSSTTTLLFPSSVSTQHPSGWWSLLHVFSYMILFLLTTTPGSPCQHLAGRQFHVTWQNDMSNLADIFVPIVWCRIHTFCQFKNGLLIIYFTFLLSTASVQRIVIYCVCAKEFLITSVHKAIFSQGNPIGWWSLLHVFSYMILFLLTTTPGSPCQHLAGRQFHVTWQMTQKSLFCLSYDAFILFAYRMIMLLRSCRRCFTHSSSFIVKLYEHFSSLTLTQLFSFIL